LLAEAPFAEEVFPELDRLLREAALTSPELAVAGLEIEQSLGNLDVAKARGRPSARLFARALGTYETRDDIGDDFKGDASINLTLTQPLYTWGSQKGRVQVAEQHLAYRQRQADFTWEHVFMEVRRAFLEVLHYRERAEVLKQSIAISQQFLDARKQLLEVGQASEQDVLFMETRLLENEEALALAERGLAIALGRLERMSGVDSIDFSASDLEWIQPMEEAAFNGYLEALEGTGVARSTWSTEQFSLLESIEEEQFEILEKQQLPMLDFVTGVITDQIEGIGAVDNVFRVRYFAGVQVNWNIFDGWATQAQKRTSLARKRLYSERASEAQLQEEETAARLLAEVRLARRQIEARAKRQDLLERRVELLREQLERNLISGSQLMEGEVELLDVRQRLLEARVTYLLRLMELEVLVRGDPMVRALKGES
jgi:outer membrane protein